MRPQSLFKITFDKRNVTMYLESILNITMSVLQLNAYYVLDASCLKWNAQFTGYN